MKLNNTNISWHCRTGEALSVDSGLASATDVVL